MIVSDFYFTSYIPTSLKFAIEKLVCLRRTMGLVLRYKGGDCSDVYWTKPILSEPTSLQSSAGVPSLLLSMRNKDTVNYFIIGCELPRTQRFP